MAAVITAENAALAALDLPRAVALLGRKSAEIANFEAQKPAGAPQETVALLAQLAALANDNRRLLDRAIKAQGRVIGIIAGVVRQSPITPRYGAHGNLRRDRNPITLTLAVRA